MASVTPPASSPARSRAYRGGLDVLVVSQFFSPEMGAPAARFHDFGKMLVERGHRVTVVTGFPNSPSGVIPAAYRGRLWDREEIDGIEVLRGWLYASPRLSAGTKSLGFGSFAAAATLRAFGARKPDVVVATSPPPTVGIPGLLTAWRTRAPLVLDIRDIWPEAIAASGRLRSGLLIRSLEAIERTLYASAAAVTVVTEGKRERLIEKGVPAAKLEVVPNGVDLARFETTAEEGTRVLAEHGVDLERFVVLYAGIFNPAQGLDVLLDAAKALRSRTVGAGRRAQIVLVGGGAERERLAGRIATEGLEDDVRLVPEQPRDTIPSILLAAHAVAVTLRPRRDSHTVPSKLYEAMASGRPVLVSADGAPAELTREADAGLVSAAGDARGLADSIATLLDDPARGEAVAARGRRRAASSDRREIVQRFEQLLLRVVADRKRSN